MVLQLFRVRFSFHEHFKGAAHKRLGNSLGDLVLLGHGEVSAAVFDFRRNLAGHGAGSCRLLLRVGKHAEPHWLIADPNNLAHAAADRNRPLVAAGDPAGADLR